MPATKHEREVFGGRLRQLRGDLTLQQVVDRVREERNRSISTAQLSAWERGEYAPRHRDVVLDLDLVLDGHGQLLEALGLPEDALVSAPAVAVGVVFAVTRGGSSSPKKVTAHGQTITLDTPAKVAQAFNAKGFECSGYKDLPLKDESQIGTDYATGKGTCSHAGKDVEIDTYSDVRHVKAQLAEIDALGCSIGKTFGITEYNIAYGATWASNWDDTLDHDVPQQMADALGGKFHHHDC